MPFNIYAQNTVEHMIYAIFFELQKDQLQLMATGLLTVFEYFQNEATSNQTNPKCGQLQPKNGPHRVLVSSVFCWSYGPDLQTLIS
jgi:hypothetical protein